MKLDNPIVALRAKGRSLRRKNDHTRIQASTTVTCGSNPRSPALSQHRLSNEDLTATNYPPRSSTLDHFGHHDDFSTNSPVLIHGDKELHDPNFVRHNWEMMSGETSYPDNQLHIGHSASPRLVSRRSTLSSRTGSSRPSSRSGSEAGGHAPAFGLGVNAFSGLSGYSQAGSMGRASSSRASSSTRGLQVEGSILRDEEAILDSDDDSSDDDDEEAEYRQANSLIFQLPTSRRSSPSPRPPLHRTEISPRSTAPPSPTSSHAVQSSAAYHRRRHWTVAEGGQASVGTGVHAMPGPMSSARSALINDRCMSQPA